MNNILGDCFSNLFKPIPLGVESYFDFYIKHLQYLKSLDQPTIDHLTSLDWGADGIRLDYQLRILRIKAEPTSNPSEKKILLASDAFGRHPGYRFSHFQNRFI